MKMIGFTETECRQALASYLAEINELMELVKNPSSMSPADVEKAKGLLSNLKSCLTRDYKLRHSRGGAEKMTEVEQAIFEPAVHQALADLHIRANTRPNEKWYSNLYDIEITISHALHQLKKD